MSVEQREYIELDATKHDLDPEFISNCTVHLISPESGAHVYIVGTAHISQKSADDVEKVIQILRPNKVVIELCRSRAGLFLSEPEKELEKAKNSQITFQDIQKSWNGGGSSGLLQMTLAHMYKQVASQMKVMPGMEFKKAHDEAKKVDAEIILGDRPVEITLKRMWGSLSVWQKGKFMWYLLRDTNLEIKAEDIERMKNSDLITELVNEFSVEFPSLRTTLIDERDIFLSHYLRKVRGEVIVGVVGLGHIKGIKERWDKPLPDFQPLMELPADKGKVTRRYLKAAFWTGLIVGVSFLARRYWRGRTGL